MKPDMKNQPARNKCTKSTSGVTKTIDKNSKSKSKISAQSMKKVSIDKLSTQGNFNGLSEYEDTTDLTYDGKCGSSSHNGSIIDKISSEDEDEEVRKIFNDIPKIMARKSTSPMKMPSYLKSLQNGNTNNSKKNRRGRQSKDIKSGVSNSNDILSNTTSTEAITTDNALNFFRTNEKIPLDFNIKTRNNVLKEFKKPVVIYSYLSLRQNYHPIFLNRNLNFTDKLPHSRKVNAPKRGNNLENVLKKIKSKINFTNQNSKTNRSAQEKKGVFFDLKLNFQSLQLNKKTINAIKQQNSDQNKIYYNDLSVEIYAMRNSFKKDALNKQDFENLVDENQKVLASGFYPLDILNLKAPIDLSSKSLNLNVESGQCSHLLIKCNIVQTFKEEEENIMMKQLSKKRKSNNHRAIVNDSSNEIAHRSPKVIKAFFVICSLDLDDKKSTTYKGLFDKVEKSYFVDLNLKDNSSYCFKMREISEKSKLMLEEYKQIVQHNDQSLERQQVKNPPEKNQLQHTQTNFESIGDQNVKDLLKQFHNSETMIRFTTEIAYKNKSPAMKSPGKSALNGLKKSPAVISVQRLSISMLNSPEKSSDFQTVNSLTKQKKTMSLPTASQHNLQIVRPKPADQFIHYNFISSSLKKNPQKTAKNNPNTQTKLSSLNRNFVCPFCYKSCKDMSFLFQHLQVNHFRFIVCEQNFTDNGESGHHSASTSSKFKKLQLDIICDEIFDGSYLGNPYDIQNSLHLGFSACRQMPTKRVPVTYILTNKKSNFVELNKFKNLTQDEITAIHLIQQQQQQLSLPMQSNNLYNIQAGMERLFYHSTTTLPIQVNEIDIDSDNELDPDWLKDYTTLLINDFADVNEGEKGLMRLWNLHLLRHNFVGDLQVYKACHSFLTHETVNLSKLNLFNNFSLHLSNLHDYGLLSPKEILALVEYMNEMRTKSEEGEKKIAPPIRKNKFKSSMATLAKIF